MAGSFDELTKDVQTLRLVEREEGTLRGDNVSGIDGVYQSLLDGLHGLDKVVLSGVELEILGAVGEFKSARESEVRLIRRLHSGVIGVVDRAESVSKTVQFVAGEKLLVKVVVARSLTNVIFLSDTLLLVLYRSLMLSMLLESYLRIK